MRLAWIGILVAVSFFGMRLLSIPADHRRLAFGPLTAGGAQSGLNILLITLDTTRADHVGAYGFQSISTPSIDSLARDGALFEQTSSSTPLTLPAHASLFTGRFPPGHGVRDNVGFVLDEHQTTLAEVLARDGYRTGAFVSSVVLASAQGLNQGFETYRDDFDASEKPPHRRMRRPANDVTDQALQWLASVGSARFFAWVHFYDAHRPYELPEPFRTAYATRPYDGAIAFMDSQVGRLLAFLQDHALSNSTIVIVMGDHGESLGDHGETAHGIFVYESVMRVPLIIRTPFERVRGRIVDDVTRSIDVMPTLLDLVGLRPEPAIEGTSLVPLMTGTARSLNLKAYSESLYPRHRFGWSELHALRAGRFKVIAAPRPELYDLENDPFEEHNEYHRRRALAEEMIAQLREMERRSGASTSAERSRVDVDPEIAARLATLGYVSQSGATRSTSAAGGLPDPKDQIGFLDPERHP